MSVTISCLFVMTESSYTMVQVTSVQIRGELLLEARSFWRCDSPSPKNLGPLAVSPDHVTEHLLHELNIRRFTNDLVTSQLKVQWQDLWLQTCMTRYEFLITSNLQELSSSRMLLQSRKKRPLRVMATCIQSGKLLHVWHLDRTACMATEPRTRAIISIATVAWCFRMQKSLSITSKSQPGWSFGNQFVKTVLSRQSSLDN